MYIYKYVCAYICINSFILVELYGLVVLLFSPNVLSNGEDRPVNYQRENIYSFSAFQLRSSAWCVCPLTTGLFSKCLRYLTDPEFSYLRKNKLNIFGLSYIIKMFESGENFDISKI